ncbi:MAG TPA: hypothetical protein VHN99_00980 [Deinococcales bacterium]|nr:hypothetical protein [Deinococcales bacterium]
MKVDREKALREIYEGLKARDEMRAGMGMDALPLRDMPGVEPLSSYAIDAPEVHFHLNEAPAGEGEVSSTQENP